MCQIYMQPGHCYPRRGPLKELSWRTLREEQAEGTTQASAA